MKSKQLESRDLYILPRDLHISIASFVDMRSTLRIQICCPCFSHARLDLCNVNACDWRGICACAVGEDNTCVTLLFTAVGVDEIHNASDATYNQGKEDYRPNDDTSNGCSSQAVVVGHNTAVYITTVVQFSATAAITTEDNTAIVEDLAQWLMT